MPAGVRNLAGIMEERLATATLHAQLAAAFLVGNPRDGLAAVTGSRLSSGGNA